MKLKNEFITHNARGETLMVPVGGSRFAGLVKGNRTLGAILDLLKQETDEASVIAAAHSRQSISSTRRRLYERTFMEKGTPSQWDEFIKTI